MNEYKKMVSAKDIQNGHLNDLENVEMLSNKEMEHIGGGRGFWKEVKKIWNAKYSSNGTDELVA